MNESSASDLLFIKVCFTIRSHVCLVVDQLNCVAELINASANFISFSNFTKQTWKFIYFNRPILSLHFKLRANTSAYWAQHLSLVYLMFSKEFIRGRSSKNIGIYRTFFFPLENNKFSTLFPPQNSHKISTKA